MTLDILIVLVLLAVATALFMLEWISVDLVALGLVVALVLTGVLTPTEAFSGFSSEIVVILASIFVITGGLLKTGVMEWLGRMLERRIGQVERAAIVGLMGLTAVLSSVVSNTSAVAILVPTVREFSRRTGIERRRLLIPVAYASMLGGTCTVIGTSTNLAASGLMGRLGMDPISPFEFTRIGLIMVVVGIAYVALAGPYVLAGAEADTEFERRDIGPYLSQVLVPPDSGFVGRSLEAMGLGARGVTVLSVLRGDRRLQPEPQLRLQADDQLVVSTSRSELLALKADRKILVEEDARLAAEDLEHQDFAIAEAIVMPQSTMVGWTFRGLQFRQRFGLSVLGIHRRGRLLAPNLPDLVLQVGDVLLLQGVRANLRRLEGRWDVRLLEELEWQPARRFRGMLGLAVLLLAIGLGASGLVPLSVALLLAAWVVVLLGCLPVDEMYDFVDWRAIVLIAAMMSFGSAMQQTGTADFVAENLIGWVIPLGPVAVMAVLVALTMLLTQPMSNAAAALVILPIAVSTADLMGIAPRSLAVLVTLAASLSFITPLEPACLLVYGPGNYTFRDFVRAGLPLSALVLIVLLVLVPYFWPLTGV